MQPVDEPRSAEMQTPPIVSPEEWKAARQQFLVKEKELTRAWQSVNLPRH